MTSSPLTEDKLKVEIQLLAVFQTTLLTFSWQLFETETVDHIVSSKWLLVTDLKGIVRSPFNTLSNEGQLFTISRVFYFLFIWSGPLINILPSASIWNYSFFLFFIHIKYCQVWSGIFRYFSNLVLFGPIGSWLYCFSLLIHPYLDAVEWRVC